jgi:hypothetical protein
MLYREIIAVCSQIHTKHIYTLCGQNMELLYVKLALHTVTLEDSSGNLYNRLFKNSVSTSQKTKSGSMTNIKSIGMWWRVVRWAVPDVSKDPIVLFFSERMNSKLKALRSSVVTRNSVMSQTPCDCRSTEISKSRLCGLPCEFLHRDSAGGGHCAVTSTCQ